MLAVLNPLLKLLVLPDESWTDAALVPPWTAYGAPVPGFWRDSSGCVHLRGMVAGGTTPGTASTLFALPAGYRPRATVLFPLVSSSWNSVQQASMVKVLATGEVKAQAFDVSTDPVATSPCNWLSIGGLIFRAEQ